MTARLALLLAERRRRQARSGLVTPEAEAFSARHRATAAQLRADFHGPQAAFYRRVPGGAKRRVGKTTRRSGKTRGGTHETVARCLEEPNYRVVYCNATEAEAKRLAWRSDTRRDGWLDVLRIAGVRTSHRREDMESGKADCFVNETDLTIDFANGSQLSIFAADNDRGLERLRGVAKHVLWVDEAQKFHDLERFIDDIIGASMADFEGEIWLTGTPSEYAAGYFFEATKEPEQGERMPGWEVHEWSVLDNPWFGETREARFDRVIRPEILRRMPASWTQDADAFVAQFMAEPPGWFRREWMGKWVMGGALFVYPVHEVTDRDLLTFAPQRVTMQRPRSPEGRELESINLDPDRDCGMLTPGWIDVEAALADLPPHWTDHRGKRHRITWSIAAGFDFGYDPDPFALSLSAYSFDVEDAYELWSWKQRQVHPDDQRDVVRWVLAHVPGVLVCVGDAGGLQKGHIIGWQERLGVAIEPADKAGKVTWIRLRGAEITAGRYHYREGSALLHEHSHLLYRVTAAGKREIHSTRVLPDKSVPGDHCSDADLYGYRHFVGRRTEFPGRAAPDPALRIQREEAEMEQAVDRASALAEWQSRNPDSYADDEYGY